MISLIYSEEITKGFWIVRASKLLALSYSISFAVGIVQYIQINTGLELLKPLSFAFMRVYDYRVQYTFTEPSFASIHIFSFLLPFIALCYLRSLQLSSDSLAKSAIKLRNLLCAIFLLSVLTGSSMLMLALAFIASLIIFTTLDLGPVKKILIVLTVLVVVMSALQFSPLLKLRLERALDPSGAKDTSTVIRNFRIQAASSALISSPQRVMFGYGFGNSAQSIKDGFGSAISALSRTDIWSINKLEYNPDTVFSLPLKIAVEFGLVGSILILFLFFKVRYSILFLMVFSGLVQFDNLSFFSIWIYAFCTRYGYLSNDQLSYVVKRIFPA